MLLIWHVTIRYFGRFLLLALLFFNNANTSFGQPTDFIVLAVGDFTTDTVFANIRCNRTSLKLVKGASYEMIATGQWQDANFEPTDANGFVGFTKAMKRGNFLKPMNCENYMKLLARVGRKKIAVGTHFILQPKRSGRLVFIPNDATFFFGNNSSKLMVTIKRLPKKTSLSTDR